MDLPGVHRPPTEFFDLLVVCGDVFGLLETICTICTVGLLKVTYPARASSVAPQAQYFRQGRFHGAEGAIILHVGNYCNAGAIFPPGRVLQIPFPSGFQELFITYVCS
jgi:hypothetical protein